MLIWGHLPCDAVERVVVSAVVAPVPTVVEEDDVTLEVETVEVDDGCVVASVETCVVEPSSTNIG